MAIAGKLRLAARAPGFSRFPKLNLSFTRIPDLKKLQQRAVERTFKKKFLKNENGPLLEGEKSSFFSFVREGGWQLGIVGKGVGWHGWLLCQIVCDTVTM